MAFFRCAVFYFRIGNDVARTEFRYLIAKSHKDTKRCMYATRTHIYCAGSSVN